jgi:hypothetical protein
MPWLAEPRAVGDLFRGVVQPARCRSQAARSHKLNDNLTQISRLPFVNAYLVREEDGFTLLDTTTEVAPMT